MLVFRATTTTGTYQVGLFNAQHSGTPADRSYVLNVRPLLPVFTIKLPF